MEIITSQTFHAFCQNKNSILLKTTYDRPKLLETSDGFMIKIFYPRKKRFSSDQFKPYAIRFYNNAEKLRAGGFHAPEIHSIYYCPDLNTYLLTYQKMEGEDTRVLANKGHHEIIPDVAAYNALFMKRCIFRSMHLENLLLQPDKTFCT